LDRHLNSAEYDVVHSALPVTRCDVYHPHAGLAIDAIANGHRKHQGWKQWVARIANQWNGRRQAFAKIERRMLAAPVPPIVISLSQYVQTSIMSHYPLPSHRHARLFNAVDLQRFDPATAAEEGCAWRRRLGLDEADILALMIAQDFARKGLTECLAALAQTPEPRLKLVVVGKPDPTMWKQQALAAGIADRVIFAGPTQCPAACYAAADVFVLPTKHDPCSLVVLEALAMGVPVITTSHNGAAEVMTSGQEGLVLSDPHDVAALADALQTVCDGPTRTAMAERCLQLRPRLSYDHHLETLLQIYGRARIRSHAA
jgi:UDP-glucose:(heptosyl)LPS alpha-1,3-glucosyltransferase